MYKNWEKEGNFKQHKCIFFLKIGCTFVLMRNLHLKIWKLKRLISYKKKQKLHIIIKILEIHELKSTKREMMQNFALSKKNPISRNKG